MRDQSQFLDNIKRSIFKGGSRVMVNECVNSSPVFIKELPKQMQVWSKYFFMRWHSFMTYRYTNLIESYIQAYYIKQLKLKMEIENVRWYGYKCCIIFLRQRNIIQLFLVMVPLLCVMSKCVIRLIEGIQSTTYQLFVKKM